MAHSGLVFSATFLVRPFSAIMFAINGDVLPGGGGLHIYQDAAHILIYSHISIYRLVDI